MQKIYTLLFISSLLFISCQKQEIENTNAPTENIVQLDENEINVVTEEFAPYNYMEDGIVKGVSTEVVRNVLKKLNIPEKIRIYPWPRALKMATEKKNVIIYSLGRNKERETIFKWIGTISPAEFFFLSLSTRKDILIKNLDEAKKYKIAVVKNSLRHQYLVEKGFVEGKNLEVVSDYYQCLRMLEKNKVDLWAVNVLNATHLSKKEGHPDGFLNRVFKLTDLSTEGYYMAFGPNTPDETVEKFKNALIEVKKEMNLTL